MAGKGSRARSKSSGMTLHPRVHSGVLQSGGFERKRSGYRDGRSGNQRFTLKIYKRKSVNGSMVISFWFNPTDVLNEAVDFCSVV